MYLVWLRSPRIPGIVQRGAAWVAYGQFGAAIILFDVVLVREILAAVSSWLNGPAVSAIWCLPVTAVLSAWALFCAQRRPPIRHIEIPLDGLPADLDGFCIMQLSDLHVGPTIRAPFVRRVVSSAQEAKPDLLVFTGDLTDGTVQDLADQVAPMRDLSAPYGFFACTGNHDYYNDPHHWPPAFAGLGMQLLNNEHVVIPVGNATLVVGGVPDPAGGDTLADDSRLTPDPAKAFANAPAGVRLLLAHQPAIGVQAHDVALTLSGHTHGGQLPPWPLIVRLQQPFVKGLKRLGDGWLYISSGCGYWGPPMRLGAPSEIACLTLRRR